MHIKDIGFIVDSNPTTEVKCSCGYITQLKVKSLKDIESEIDFLQWQLNDILEKHKEDNMYNKCIITLEGKIEALKWVIGLYDEH